MSIIVAPSEGGKWQVLVNYVRHGVAYSSEIQAQKEAEAVRTKIFGKNYKATTPK